MISTMKISTSYDSPKTRIALSGRFDFSSHRLFRDNCEKVLSDAATREIEIDLGEVSYLDSSALSMLLLLREKAKNADKAIALENCRETVRQVLDVANFNKLFTIR